MAQNLYDLEEKIEQLARFFNEFKSGSGSGLPPRLLGRGQVPVVSNVELKKKAGLRGSTQFTLSWSNPTGQNTSHLNVYVKQMANSNSQPSLIASVAGSPAEFVLETDKAGAVVFVIQTVLRNGYSSKIEESPTITSTVDAANVAGTAGWIGDTEVAALTITSSPNTNKINGTDGFLQQNTTTGRKIQLLDGRIQIFKDSTGVGKIDSDGDGSSGQANSGRVELTNSSGTWRVRIGTGLDDEGYLTVTSSAGTGASLSANTDTAKRGLFVTGNRVVGPRATAIADADGTLADITTKFNDLLSKLRTHGLIAT